MLHHLLATSQTCVFAHSARVVKQACTLCVRLQYVFVVHGVSQHSFDTYLSYNVPVTVRIFFVMCCSATDRT